MHPVAARVVPVPRARTPGHPALFMHQRDKGPERRAAWVGVFMTLLSGSQAMASGLSHDSGAGLSLFTKCPEVCPLEI